MWCFQSGSSSHWKLDFWKNGHFDHSPKWLSGVDNNFYRTYSESTSLNLLKKPDMSKIVQCLLYLLHGWKSRFFPTKANVCQKLKNFKFDLESWNSVEKSSKKLESWEKNFGGEIRPLTWLSDDPGQPYVYILSILLREVVKFSPCPVF